VTTLDDYRVLVTELGQGSDLYDDLIEGLEAEDYRAVETSVDDLDALANPFTDWYDAVVVSMDDARDVDYDGDVLDDAHLVLEGVTPLWQPDHIDAAYNTADRVEDVGRSLHRDEWQAHAGVGEEIAGLLDDQRPGSVTDEELRELLMGRYGRIGAALADGVDRPD